MHGNVEQSYCQPHVCRPKAIFIWPHVIKVKHSLEEFSTLADCFVFITLPFAPRASSHHKDLPVSQDQSQTGRAALPLEGESKWGSYKQPNLSGQYDIPQPPTPPPPPPPSRTHNTRQSDPEPWCRALISALGLRVILTDMRGMWFISCRACARARNHAKWCERFWSELKVNKNHWAGMWFNYQRLVWQHLHLLIKILVSVSLY